MAKTVRRKEYVLLDWENKNFRKFEIEILAVGKSQYHVISTNGPITTKGRDTLVRCSNINEAFKIYDKQIWLKEQEGFESVESTRKAHEIGMKIVKEEKRKKYYSPSAPKGKTAERKTDGQCDLCSADIKADKYNDINNWARGGGGWDTDKQFVGYKKVLCVDCQIENGIYRKSFTKSKTSPSKKKENKKNNGNQ